MMELNSNFHIYDRIYLHSNGEIISMNNICSSKIILRVLNEHAFQNSFAI